MSLLRKTSVSRIWTYIDASITYGRGKWGKGRQKVKWRGQSRGDHPLRFVSIPTSGHPSGYRGDHVGYRGDHDHHHYRNHYHYNSNYSFGSLHEGGVKHAVIGNNRYNRLDDLRGA